MSQINTVRGPIDTAELGRTYMHEHVFVLTPDVQQNYPDEWGSEDERVADAVTKLRALAAQGVRTIVDPTVIGLGRYIPRIQRIAEQLPELNIVVGNRAATPTTTCRSSSTTAVRRWRRSSVPTSPTRWSTCSSSDIEEGIADTGVRAGLLKCAIDQPGAHAGCRAGDAGRRQGPPAHRRARSPCTPTPAARPGCTSNGCMCDEEGVDARTGSCSGTAATAPTSTT